MPARALKLYPFGYCAGHYTGPKSKNAREGIETRWRSLETNALLEVRKAKMPARALKLVHLGCVLRAVYVSEKQKCPRGH